MIVSKAFSAFSFLSFLSIVSNHMFWFFNPLRLDAKKALSDKECIRLKKIKLKRGNVFFPYELLGSIDKLNNMELTPKEAFYSKLNR